ERHRRGYGDPRSRPRAAGAVSRDRAAGGRPGVRLCGRRAARPGRQPVNLVIREALLAFRRAPLLSALSVTTIAFSLFVVGLFGLVAVNLQQALRGCAASASWTTSGSGATGWRTSTGYARSPPRWGSW